MARVTIRGTDTVLHAAEAIVQALQPHGVSYERWSTAAVPAWAGERETLDAEHQDKLLTALQGNIQHLIERRGYRTADIVVLGPNTPNLAGLLTTFRREHCHTEDEVRFVVDGEGVFSIHGRDDRVYDVLVQPGDLLIVGAGTWHWFDLTGSQRIKCVRVFQTTEGWKALFREEATVS